MCEVFQWQWLFLAPLEESSLLVSHSAVRKGFLGQWMEEFEY